MGAQMSAAGWVAPLTGFTTGMQVLVETVPELLTRLLSESLTEVLIRFVNHSCGLRAFEAFWASVSAWGGDAAARAAMVLVFYLSRWFLII
jgi:hypothetical protein